MEIDNLKTLVETNLPDNRSKLITAKKIRDVFEGTGTDEGILDAFNEGKCNPDGYYTDLSVGLAENLISPDGVTNEEPYIFRTTAGSTSVATGNAEITTIKGNTVVWNQQIYNGNFESTYGWTLYGSNNTFTVENNIGTLICQSEDISSKYRIYQRLSYWRDIWIAGHTYILKWDVKADIGISLDIGGANYSLIDSDRSYSGSGSWKTLYLLFVHNYYTGSGPYPNLTYSCEVGDTVYMRNVQLFDCTKMFGAGNEPTVEEFEYLFPKPYYSYNAGELISLKPDTLRTVGFNQWDEQWEEGAYSVDTGEKLESTNKIRSANYIPAFPNTTYFITSSNTQYMCAYDADKNFIGILTMTSSDGGKLFTTPDNCRYLRFNFSSAYGTEYQNNVTLNIAWSGYRNGEYEAYNKHTISLPITSIKDSDNNTLFPDGLRSAGDVYDEITSTKAIKRVGSVDLGSLTWNKGTTSYGGIGYYFVSGNLPYNAIYRGNGSSTTSNLIESSGNYTIRPYYDLLGATDKSINVGIGSASGGSKTNPNVFIVDSSYTDAATFKTAMSGVKLYYELAEPIEVDFTEVPQSFGTTLNLTYAMDDFGTEEIVVSNSTDEVPTAPMAHSTFYMNNLRDKIRNIDGNTDAGAVMIPSMKNLLETLSSSLHCSMDMEWNETSDAWDFDISCDWYGVEFSSSSPDGIRIGNPSLHQSCPIQSGMRCCLLSDDGTVASYLSSTDRTKLEDGTTTASLDGSAGQVMVEIPEHYRRLEYDSSSWRVMVSTVALDGFVHVPKCYIGAYKATVDRTTSTYKLSSVKNSTAAFRGGNGSNSSWDGTYRTLLQRPASNESLITYRTYAANRGTGWYQHLWDIKKAVYWLFVTEYATLNSQKAFNSTLLDGKYHQGGLGDGVTTLASAAWSTFNSYHPFTNIGITDSLGNATGTVSFTMPTEYSSTTTTVSVPSYRGIENPFGEIWEWVDGVCVDVQSSADGNKSLIYTCNDLSGIDYTSSLSAYDYVGDAARSSGYASQMVQNTTGDVVPTTVGGSASTYFCDYYYTTVPSSGTSRRGVLVGGNAHYGAYAGLVYVHTYHVPSYTNAYVGSRLCYLP